MVEIAGERLLDRAVRLAREAGCDPIVVVLGGSAEEIEAACDLQGCAVVRNEGWRDGLASSIRAGVLVLRERGAARTILTTCDQPAVTAEHLRLLASVSPEAVVASAYAGRHGVPAYFPADSWETLTRLSGDMGAREMLRSAEAVELPGGELDVDTEASLRLARELLERR
jgi:molybdenum cofactor cytidylyltransferase